MCETEQKTTSSDESLATDIQKLSREFNSLKTFYACFCDALAEVLVEGRELDACTVEGISRSSRWLKCRIEEIGEKLDKIQKRSS